MFGYTRFVNWFARIDDAPPIDRVLLWHAPTGDIYQLGRDRRGRFARLDAPTVKVYPTRFDGSRIKRTNRTTTLRSADLVPVSEGEAVQYARVETEPVRGAAAFTLVELLVAIGVTALLIVMIGSIMRSVGEGVGMGIATSNIVQNSRVASDQIGSDFAAMVAPQDNGVLVITNQVLSDVPFAETDVPAGEPRFRRRTDQVMFVRSADRLDAITPETSDTYSPHLDATASFALTRYGHGLLTDNSGTLDPADARLGIGPNEYSAEWVLTRQAMMLSTDVDTGDTVHAEDARAGANVHNAETHPDVPHAAFSGLTDVAASGLVTEHDDTGNAVLADTPDSEGDDGQRLYRTLDGGDYALRALTYTYANDRLRLNQGHVFNPDNADLNYAAWQIAQAHSALSMGVTDFIVEFAGNYDQTGANANRDIDLDDDGRIVWYGQDTLPPEGAGGFNDGGESPVMIDGMTDAGGDTYTAFVFRHGPEEDTNWPEMVRIRYRITDPQGRVSSDDGLPGRHYEQIIDLP